MRHAWFVILGACWTSPAPRESAVPTEQRSIDTQLIVTLVDAQRVREMVDPAVGLVFLDRFFEPGEPPGTTSERHLCDAELDRFLRTEWAREVGRAITAAQENGLVACSKDTCRAGGRGEYDPVFHFHFARTAGRLVLRAVSYDDEVLVSADDIRAEHAMQAALVVKLSVPCE